MTSHFPAVCWLLHSALFAARSSGRRRGAVSTSEMLLYLGIAVVVIVVVCLSVYCGSRWSHWRQFKSPAGLFLGLCKVHALDRRTQALLKQIARHHNLPQPARLFTEPKWLDPTALKGPMASRARQISELRSRLFRDGSK